MVLAYCESSSFWSRSLTEGVISELGAGGLGVGFSELSPPVAGGGV